jgi:hypothetical protein
MNTVTALSTSNKIKLSVLVLFVFALLITYLTPSMIQAAAAQEVYLRLDRVKASTATGGMVCMETNAADTGTEDGVLVQFPSDFTLDETEANWTVSTTNLPDGATAWPGIAVPTGAGNYMADNTAKTVWFVSTDLSANTLYCFNFSGTTTLTNPAAGNSKTGSISAKAGATTTDTGSYGVSIISEDQVTVSATVPAIFTLALSGTAISHGTLTAGTVDSGSVTATIGTNANAGWVSWVRAGAASLASASTGASITSPDSVDNATSDLTGATYGWVLDVIPTQDADGDGTISQGANYGQEYDGGDTCGTSTTGGTFATTFTPIAASDGTSDSEQLEICSLVRVPAFQTAASDYTQTVTFTAAGRF